MEATGPLCAEVIYIQSVLPSFHDFPDQCDVAAFTDSRFRHGDSCPELRKHTFPAHSRSTDARSDTRKNETVRSNSLNWLIGNFPVGLCVIERFLDISTLELFTHTQHHVNDANSQA